MSRFSTPDEIFGPVSISKLKDADKYERNTEVHLPLKLLLAASNLGVKIVKTIHSAKGKIPFLEFFMNICHNRGYFFLNFLCFVLDYS